MDRNKKTKSSGWKMRKGDSFAATSLNDAAKAGAEAGEALKKIPLTKQQKDHQNLESTLIYLLEHFDEFVSSCSEASHLMAIGISCKHGEFYLDYGHDSVVKEIDKHRKELKKAKKKK